jgi:hypothetical protein
VRFAANDPEHFDALRSLYAEVKRDKVAGQFRDQVGPLIALAGAFGFTVLGVNECGKY